MTLAASPFRAGPVVSIAYAGGDDAVACRWADLFGPSPAEAVRSVLLTLELEPRDISIRALRSGELVVLAHWPDETPRAVAFIEHLSLPAAREGLGELCGRFWPAPLNPRRKRAYRP